MKRFFRFVSFSLCVFILGPVGLRAQSTGSIEGRVTMPTGEAAHRATVLIVDLGRTTETDEDGRYRFDDVPAGTYDVLTYQTPLDSETFLVELAAGETVSQDLELRISPVRTEITVTARGREESTFEAIPSVTSLDAFALSESMATSLGDVLRDQPGVATRSFGVGNARPVIRGFDGDRVLVMQDGMRSGSVASQSGDHAEPIDPSNLERIEVLKGPATLLYGSNAIGGVVNAISSHQQFHQQSHQGLVGQISSALGSANAQAGASYNLEYGAGPWEVWAGGGGQRTGDYATPIGPVPNSKSRISNGAAGFGWFGDRAYASIGYRGNEGRYGIPYASDFEGLDAIDIAYRQHNARFTGGLRGLGSVVDSFELSANYSDYNHDEVEILAGDQGVGTSFEDQEFVYRGVLTQSPLGRLSGSFGFEGRSRDYEAIGEEALSPPIDQSGFAVFGLEEIDLEHVKIQAGARIERNRYSPALGAGLSDTAFTGLSAGIGARFDLWRGGAFVANYTDSYRAPALEELYNNGPHVGNLTFELGNPALSRERSHGADFSLRQQGDRLQGEINVYYYSIDDFVYLAPTGAVQDGLIEAAYDQGDARFLGTEARFGVGLTDELWLNLGVDAVDARLTSASVPLPRIPPVRASLGLDFRYGNFSIQPELVMAGRKDDIFTTETPTAGYVVGNLKASWTIPTQHLSHHLSVEVFNLGNVLYRNHLSFIKDQAPEIGRGVRFAYAVKLF